MKKILVLLLSVLAVICLSGCKDTIRTGDDAIVPIPGANWVALCYHENFSSHCTARIFYFYDKDTEIVYMYSEGISTVYNKDGKPMTKTEFNKVHTNKYHKEG